MKIASETKGTFLAVLSTFLWGTVFIIARHLLGRPAKIDPYSLVFFRYAAGSAMVFAWAAFKHRPLWLGSRARLGEALKTSLFLYWLMTVFFFIGQQTVTATTASLFVESCPALLLILWKIITRQPTTKIEFLTCVLGVFGCSLVLNIISTDGIHLSGSFKGQGFVLLAAVSWVIGGFCGKRLMSEGDRLVATAWCQMFCALFTLPLMAVMHKSLLIPTDAVSWLCIAAMGLFPTAMAFVLWGEAMKLLPLWKLNLTQNLTPVFTIIGACLLIGETASPLNLLGVLIVLLALSAAVLWGQAGRK